MVHMTSYASTYSYNSTYKYIVCACPSSTQSHIIQDKKSQYSLIQEHLPHTSTSTSKYDSNTNSSQNIYLFPSLGLGLGLWLHSNQTLVRNRYISLHATTDFAYYLYLYVLCKYYHTNNDRGVTKIHMICKYSTLTKTGSHKLWTLEFIKRSSSETKWIIMIRSAHEAYETLTEFYS